MGQGSIAVCVVACAIEGLWRDVLCLQNSRRHVGTPTDTQRLADHALGLQVQLYIIHGNALETHQSPAQRMHSKLLHMSLLQTDGMRGNGRG